MKSRALFLMLMGIAGVTPSFAGTPPLISPGSPGTLGPNDPLAPPVKQAVPTGCELLYAGVKTVEGMVSTRVEALVSGKYVPHSEEAGSFKIFEVATGKTRSFSVDGVVADWAESPNGYAITVHKVKKNANELLSVNRKDRSVRRIPALPPQGPERLFLVRSPGG